MDKLKQYLREHSSALDNDEPGENAWNNILRQTTPAPAPVRKLYTRWYAIAAAAVLVCLAGWQWIMLNDTAVTAAQPLAWDNKLLAPPQATVVKTVQHVEAVKQEKAVTTVPPDMTAVLGSFSRNYSRLVRLQEKAIRHTPVMAEAPDYFEDFRLMLRQMDNEEILIRKEMKKNGKEEVLLEQLITLYQQKLEVLKALQTEIGKLNGRTKEERQRTGTTGSYYLNI